MTTTKNRKEKGRTRKGRSPSKQAARKPPTRKANRKPTLKKASGTQTGGRFDDRDKDRSRTAKKTAVSQAMKSKVNSTRAKQPRIALADKSHADAMTKAVKELPTSKDHVCWKRNGKIKELYYRKVNKTPILVSAPCSSAVDESGYRTSDATAAVTGIFHVKQAIKKLTGKTPSALGIKLPRVAAAPAARTNKASQPRKKRSGLSGLDAAAQVLAKAKAPLNAKTIAQRAIATGWKTKGQTPHATLYAAMIREVSAKGKDSRFIRVDKGLFTAAGRST